MTRAKRERKRGFQISRDGGKTWEGRTRVETQMAVGPSRMRKLYTGSLPETHDTYGNIWRRNPEA